MTYSRPNWTLALGLPLLVIVACVVIVFSPLFALHTSRLSTAVTLDLTVTMPLLYFLAIRQTSVSKMTVIRVFVVGVLVAGLLLSGRSPLLHGIKTWVSPVVEMTVVLTIAWRFYRVRKQGRNPDFLTQARAMAGAVTGSQRVGEVMGSELAVLYYAFSPSTITVPADSPHPLKAAAFSYARAGGALPVLGVFMMAMVAEGIGLHFLIAHWSVTTAWVLTGFSAYTLLQLFAHMRAIKARPIVVEEGVLHLRNGLAADVSVRIAEIEEMTLTRKGWSGGNLSVGKSSTAGKSSPVGKTPSSGKTLSAEDAPSAEGEKVLQLALFGALESHTVRVKLREPVTVIRMFGIRRQANILLFAVDKGEELIEIIRLKKLSIGQNE